MSTRSYFEDPNCDANVSQYGDCGKGQYELDNVKDYTQYAHEAAERAFQSSLASAASAVQAAGSASAANNSAGDAAESANQAQGFANNAASSADIAANAVDVTTQLNKEAQEAAAAAKVSEENAYASQEASKTSEDNAALSATNAKASEDRAAEILDEVENANVYRGAWDPTTNAYPPVPTTNSKWDVSLPAGVFTHTFDGIDWVNGDALVYLLADKKFQAVKGAIGVSSVNNKTGAVTLGAADVGAVPASSDWPEGVYSKLSRYSIMPDLRYSFKPSELNNPLQSSSFYFSKDSTIGIPNATEHGFSDVAIFNGWRDFTGGTISGMSFSKQSKDVYRLSGGFDSDTWEAVQFYTTDFKPTALDVGAVQMLNGRTGAAELPTGNVGTRPLGGGFGLLRFNSEDAVFEGYNPVTKEWGPIGGGNAIPVGAIALYPKFPLPPGWLPLDGTDYPDMAETFPTFYKYWGSTTLPDWSDRVPKMVGTDLTPNQAKDWSLPDHHHWSSTDHGTLSIGSNSHSHSRGSMNITGTFGQKQIEFYSQGAFYDAGNWAENASGAGNNGQLCGFDASRSWTGNTSEYTHSHSIGGWTGGIVVGDGYYKCPTSPTNEVNRVGAVYAIKVADMVTDEGLAQMTGINDRLTKLESDAITESDIIRDPKSLSEITGKIPSVGDDSVMEIGRYIDFHHNNDNVFEDFDIRLYVEDSPKSNQGKYLSVLGGQFLSSNWESFAYADQYLSGAPYMSHSTVRTGEGNSSVYIPAWKVRHSDTNLAYSVSMGIYSESGSPRYAELHAKGNNSNEMRCRWDLSSNYMSNAGPGGFDRFMTITRPGSSSGGWGSQENNFIADSGNDPGIIFRNRGTGMDWVISQWGGGELGFCTQGLGTGAGSSSRKATLNADMVWSAFGFTNVSDLRKKENVEELSNCLDKVSELRGVSYNFIDNPETRKAGYIAQEVQRVLPEAITISNDEMGTLTVDNSALIGLLIGAIQELKAEVDYLKNKGEERWQ